MPTPWRHASRWPTLAISAQLVKLQAEWTRANMEKCAAYWRDLYEVAARTQGELGEPGRRAAAGHRDQC